MLARFCLFGTDHRAVLLRCMHCPGQAAAIFASSSGAVVLLAGATAFHLAARRGLALLRAATLSHGPILLLPRPPGPPCSLVVVLVF